MSSLRVSLFLAARSVARSNHGIAWATALMMLLIYVSLLFLPSLIQGAINRVNAQLVNTLTSNVVITPASRGTSMSDVDAYLAAIRRAPGVAQATAVYHVGIEVSSGASTGSWSVDAIDPASYARVFTTPRDIFDGGPLTQRATNQVLLGHWHRRLRPRPACADTGRPCTTSTPATRSASPSSAARPRRSPWLASTTTSSPSPTTARTSPCTRRRSWTRPSRTARLRSTSAPAPAPTSTRSPAGCTALRGGVKSLTSANLGATVQDQVATYRLISDILKVISLLMAALTIVTITYIDVVHRRRQIGVARAIGIRPAPIVASYVLKAWAYALAGVGVGLVLFRYAVVPFVSSHPFQFPNGPVALAATTGEMTRDLVFLVVVAALAALAPALRSVRIPILDSIWAP